MPSLSETDEPIGRVYTPESWARWLLAQSDAVSRFRSGASFCDPTCGEGAFIFALLDLLEESGLTIDSEVLSRVYGFDIDSHAIGRLLARLVDRFGEIVPNENFSFGDFLEVPSASKFDILAGNPPWVNFTDLNEANREVLSGRFIQRKLVKNRKNVLFGASHADIAALITNKALQDNLNENGIALFFLPLSLFFNDGANDNFRPYPGSNLGYSVRRLWEFRTVSVFPDVSTRYGAVEFRWGNSQTWPVTFVSDPNSDQEWVASCSSSDKLQASWIVENSSTQDGEVVRPILAARKDQKPRQGVNSCGAASIFILSQDQGGFFDQSGCEVDIENELIFPLLSAENFGRKRRASKKKFVLLPHHPETGKPLTLGQLEGFPRAFAYLTKNRSRLEERRGAMIQGHINRGQWWALIGVGPYSFAPWKVVWESLGRSEFCPVVVEGRWQGNQAQHAMCGCLSKRDAEDLCQKLSDRRIEEYLRASRMGGTMNWAQPGRISKMFRFDENQNAFAF